MGRVFQNNLTSGEVDPHLLARLDVEAVANGMRRGRNVMVQVSGGVVRRPGTVTKVELGSVGAVRQVPFVFSDTQRYTVWISAGTLTVTRGGAVRATVAAPLLIDDIIPELSFVQEADTLLIFHKTLPTQALQRQGSDTSWSVFAWPYGILPTFRFSAAPPNAVLTPGATDGSNVTFTASASVFGSAAAGWGIRSLFGGYARIESVQSGTSVTATIETSFPKNAAGNIRTPGAGNWYLEEPIYSTARGWPACGAIFAGRLWIMGGGQLPNRFAASRTLSRTDFNAGKIDDDYGITGEATFAEGEATILEAAASEALQIFTDLGEGYMPLGPGDVLTPTNAAFRTSSKRGIKTGVGVVPVEGRTLFAERSGISIRGLRWDEAAQNQTADNISRLSEHLIRNPVAMTRRRATRTMEGDLIVVANEDGTCAALVDDREHGVAGWTLWEFQADCVTVAAEGERLFAGMRHNDGLVYIEELVADVMVDAGFVASGLAAPAQTITGLPAVLEGREVDIVLDGFVQERQTVNGQAITFPRPAQESFQIGLPWPVVADDGGSDTFVAEPVLPIRQTRRGLSYGQRQRVIVVDVDLYETQVCRVKGREVPIRRYGVGAMASTPTLRTGVVRLSGFLGWSRDPRVPIGHRAPAPFGLRSVMIEMED